jgi:hypothetical protein
MLANVLDDPERAARSTSAESISDTAKPHRGRRLSWAAFYTERPDLAAANDNVASGRTAVCAVQLNERNL